MRKTLFFALNVFSMLLVSVNALSQVEFDLLPKNVINYIGKVDKSQFEKIVGEGVTEEGFFVYNVINKFDKQPTDIRCFYRESDGKLISLKFPTTYYLGYWINFSRIEGYHENLNCKAKKNLLGEIIQVNLVYERFGCQILDIVKNSYYVSAIINYHTVK